MQRIASLHKRVEAATSKKALLMRQYKRAAAKSDILNCTLWYLKLGNNILGTNLYPRKVIFDITDPNISGICNISDEVLRFNLKIAEDDLFRFTHDDVPHEVAHYFDYLVNGAESHEHPKSWKKMTKLLTGVTLKPYFVKKGK